MAVYGRSRGWSMQPPVALAGSSVVWRGNEPVGSTALTERPFNAQPEAGWGLVAASGSTANFSIQSDPTAPHSPSNVGRIQYPAGFAGGGEPCNTFANGVTNFKKFYCCFAFKFSSPWEGHSTGTNKILHFFVNGSNRVYLSGYGSTTDPLLPEVALQGLASNFNSFPQGGLPNALDTGAHLIPNQSGTVGTALVRGVWSQWEILVDCGTAGNADATVDAWVDGVYTHHYTGIPLIAAAGNAKIEDLQWAPTWGGAGGSISVDQYEYIDHLYLSGHA